MGRLPLSGRGGRGGGAKAGGVGVSRAEVVRAAAELESALEIRPDEGEWWEALGMARHALGEFGPAADAYRRAMNLSVDHSTGEGDEDSDARARAGARIRLASVLRLAGRAQEALDVLAEIEGDVARRGGGRAPEFCLKILLYAELGRHEQAVETYYLARTYDDDPEADAPSDDDTDEEESDTDEGTEEDNAGPPTLGAAPGKGTPSSRPERSTPGCASCDLALAISLVMRAATRGDAGTSTDEESSPTADRSAARAAALLLPLLPSRGERGGRGDKTSRVGGVPLLAVWVWLARAYAVMGRRGEAVRCYAAALNLVRGSGDAGGESSALFGRQAGGTGAGGAGGAGAAAELHLEIASLLERGGEVPSRGEQAGDREPGGGGVGGAGGAGGDAALVHYREAVRAASTDRPGVAALAHLGMARRLAVWGRVSEAAESAASALALDPTLGGAHLFLAAGLLVSGGKGARNAAWGHLSRELALGPTDPGLLFMAARLADELRRPRLAMELLRKVLAIDPGQVAAMQDLARLLFRKRRLAEGAELTFRALRLRPGDPALLHNLALALARSGHLRAALDYASAASDPGLEHLRRRLRIAHWTRWWRRSTAAPR